MDEASTAAWQRHVQEADSAARVEVDEADRAHGNAHHHSAQQQQQQQQQQAPEERQEAWDSADVAQRGGQQHAPRAQEPGVQEPALQRMHREESLPEQMHREESLPEQPQEQPQEHVNINKEEPFATQPPAETHEAEVC